MKDSTVSVRVESDVKNEAEGILDLTKAFFPALIGSFAFAAIYFFVCKYLMEKRLNLA